MVFLSQFGQALLDLSLASAPWLLVGFVAAGFIRAYLSPAMVGRFLTGRWGVVNAALLGAPLPLCSCGVIPAAVALRKQGASRGSTVSFLVSVPETGVDSVAISYALLGPFMAIVRPIAAIATAIVAGVVTVLLPEKHTASVSLEVAPDSSCCGGAKTESAPEPTGSCCQSKSADTKRRPSLMDGMRFAATELLDSVIPWLVVGLVLAALIVVFVTPEHIGAWGQGPLAMVIMVLLGVPMYICATASTPLAASLLLVGVSPGTVLVFLLAGPATNLATLGVVRKELGTRTAVAYVAVIATLSICFGLATDWLVGRFDINIAAQAKHHMHVLPHWVAWVSLALLVFLSIPPLRRLVLGGSATPESPSDPPADATRGASPATSQ